MLRISFVTYSLAALGVLGSQACNKSGGGKSSDTPPPVPPTTETAQTGSTGEPLPLDGAGNPIPGTPGDVAPPPAPGEPGSEGVRPAEPVEPEVPPTPPPTELRIKESQFWIHKRVEDALTFNTPWDEEEGDGILREGAQVPAYAQKCLNKAKDTYANLAATQAFQDRMKPLLEKRVTPELTFLVTVSEGDNDRDALRRLDRDAYFWHWTDPAKRPVVSLNQYEKGSWVWEVIATPKNCIQPSVYEMGRLLDWTSRRLAEKGANP